MEGIILSSAADSGYNRLGGGQAVLISFEVPLNMRYHRKSGVLIGYSSVTQSLDVTELESGRVEVRRN